ncbi:hypothetical protein OROMI_014988 [Orobanche minor]
MSGMYDQEGNGSGSVPVGGGAGYGYGGSEGGGYGGYNGGVGGGGYGNRGDNSGYGGTGGGGYTGNRDELLVVDTKEIVMVAVEAAVEEVDVVVVVEATGRAIGCVLIQGHCGNSNFARRTECNKCGAPSLAGSDDRGGRGSGGGLSRGERGRRYKDNRGGRDE